MKIFTVYYEDQDGNLKKAVIIDKTIRILAKKLKKDGIHPIKITDITDENAINFELLKETLVNSGNFKILQIEYIMKIIIENCNSIKATSDYTCSSAAMTSD